VTRERLKALLAEYGQMALYVYFGLFVLVFAGFAVAIAAGVQVESAQGGAGVLGMAYLATKVTQPLRIAATLALTPLVAAAIKKIRRAPADEHKPTPTDEHKPTPTDEHKPSSEQG
jgi:hypothetical protein